MAVLEVFDPPMCCDSGVCGPEVDPRLVQFAADLRWLAAQGVTVARHNLTQEPAAFVANSTVKKLIGMWGTTCLPLILHDQNVLVRGRYPTRFELASKLGLAERVS